MMRIAILFAIGALVLFILASGALPAQAAGILTVRPQGFAGEGHAENHEHYQGLRNPEGMSCCNGQDCRPTVARHINGFWEIMVNGEWRSDFTGGAVLTDAWLRMEQARLGQPVTGRWDTQAHVCASLVPTGATAAYKPNIYCVILNDEWN